MNTGSSSDDKRHQPRHPIGVVSRRTGLKQDLIRAWERRYDAVEPARTETNRRLYTDADVERLTLLRQAVDAGRSIGRVAGLADDELVELVAEDRAAAAQAPRAAAAEEPAGTVEDDAEMLRSCLAAVRRLDAADLEERLQRAATVLGHTALLERLVAPLLERIGELWRAGELRPLHEHLATAAVRSLIGSLQLRLAPEGGTAPHLVATTPAFQQHEVGALLAAATAASEGWRVTYLGPSLPAEEIAAAALQSGARAVALSITYPPDDPRLGSELRRLRERMGDEPALLVGGRSAGAYADAVDDAAGRLCADLQELRQALEELRGPT